MEQLYATPVSQPSRAVSWLCKLNNHPVNYINVNTAKGESRTVAFRQLNPMGKIPVLKDGDWVLTESNAILFYLAEKHGWEQWYPKDLKTRARIHEYMNWHHHYARRSSEIFLAVLMGTIGRSTPSLEAKLKAKDQTMKTIFTMLEHWLSHGRDQSFLVTESHPTLADVACYHEIIQLEVMGLMREVEAKYPKVALWMKTMKTLPHHDEELAPMTKFFKKFDMIDKFGGNSKL